MRGVYKVTSFKLMNSSIAADRSLWLNVWASWEEREVAAHPTYCELFCRPDDQAMCCLMEDAKGTVLFPFILRPLAGEPWASEYADTHDIITPYGYGGPFAWGDPDWRLFWQEFNEWARSSNIASLFARLSLFEDQLIPFDGCVETKAPNIVRTLSMPADELWMDYEHKVRKNVKKARRSGLVVGVDYEGARLDDFLDIYTQTMQRRDAAEFYYFDREFFETLIKDLFGSFAFFHALQNQQVVSTELVLLSANHMYSFLGGTRVDAFDLRANDLLKHSIVRWGIENGKKAYVLGGGYEYGDGIFRYKMSFAPNGQVPFRVGCSVYDPDLYTSLIRSREQWESEQGIGWRPSLGFFPEYRG
ncbi:MAG TPA: methicillin resistance protein [Firmicutes bacterium]|nr:methicillin resistance protein [Bacillota bacterium]